MTSHSSRVRELKKSKSGGKMVNSEDENRAPILSKTESEKNNEKLVDEDLTKYTVNELRDKLKVSRRETANRDVTIRALQRNYETLCSTNDETKKEHMRRKEAFDALTDKYAQAEVKLSAEIEKGRKLQKSIADLQEAAAKAKSAAADARKAEEAAKEELKEGLGRLQGMEERWDALNEELAEGRAAVNRGERALKESTGACEALRRDGAEKSKALGEANRALEEARVKLKEIGVLRDRVKGLEGEVGGKIKELKNANGMLSALRDQRRDGDARVAELEGMLAAAREGGDKVGQEASSMRQRAEKAIADLKASEKRESALMTELEKGKRRLSALEKRMSDELEAFRSEGGGLRERVCELERDLLASQAENSRLFDEHVRVQELLEAERAACRSAMKEAEEAHLEAQNLSKQLEESRGDVARVAGERDAMMCRLESTLKDKETETGAEAEARKKLEQQVMEARAEAQRREQAAQEAARKAAEERDKAAAKVFEAKLREVREREGAAAEELARRGREAEEAREREERARLEAREAEEEASRRSRELVARVEELNERAGAVEERRRGAEKSLAEALAENEGLRAQLEKAMHMVEGLSDEMNGTKNKAEELAKEMEAKRREAALSKNEHERALQREREIAQRSLAKAQAEEEERVRKEKEALSRAHQESEGALEARLGELAGQLSDLQAQGGGVREELRKSREEVGWLRGELERLEEEVVGLKREVAEGRRAAEAFKGRVAELEASGVRDKERLEKYAGEVMGLERDFGACRGRARGLDTELAGLREKIAVSERERVKAVEEAGKLKERVGALSGLDGKEREVARAVKQMWSAAEAMEGALTCLECMGLVNRAVTLNPCGHTVCHECWDKRRTNCGRKECGECSSLVEGTIDMPAMDQLASKLGFQKQALRALGENK